jgi:hypothetical protein
MGIVPRYKLGQSNRAARTSPVDDLSGHGKNSLCTQCLLNGAGCLVPPTSGVGRGHDGDRLPGIPGLGTGQSIEREIASGAARREKKDEERYCPSIHISPSSKNSFFQMGTIFFSLSIE